MDESVCAPTANLFISYTPFQLALSFHVIVSGVTLFLIIPVIQEVKKSYFHPNCKILLIYLLIWFILHALSMGFTMTLFAFMTYSYILEKEDFSSMVPYCTLGNQYTLPHLDLWFRYTPIVDISCLLIMLILAFRNGKAKKFEIK
ncbi:unnamed protein product, partial [Mesorhabditis belari]|uniref:Uncharacterized protein n=1 Tax=Mesorhabditis belari TaxID=2138241 RepID=A0AAF3EWS0_9BILA